MKDRAKLQRDAVRLAVVEARFKAEAAAAGAGRAIDRIIRIDEQGSAIPIPGPRPFLEQRVAAADAAPPISAGQIELRAAVTLTASLK